MPKSFDNLREWIRTYILTARKIAFDFLQTYSNLFNHRDFLQNLPNREKASEFLTNNRATSGHL